MTGSIEIIKSGLVESIEFFFYLMISFAFFVGIMLVISYEAFESFNAALQKEYGIKKRIVPKVEVKNIRFIDWLIKRYPFISGLLISVMSFWLLLYFKMN